jgi:hypothetical protein
VNKEADCAYDKTKGKVMTTVPDPYEQIYANSEYMMGAIDEKPATVMINADNDVFRTYRGGVISGGCDFNESKYSSLVFGYDSTSDAPYWMVRMSWGSEWGEQGNVRIGMASGVGICGIN